MSTLSIDFLNARVARLELEAHRWKRRAFMGVLGSFVLLFGGADSDTSPKDIRAKSVRLFDDRGKCRGVFGVADNQDDVVLVLLDPQERIRAEIVVPRSGHPELRFQNKNEQVRAQYGLDEDDEPMLGFDDENGWQRVIMNWTSRGGGSGLFFMDQKKSVASAIGVKNNGEPFIFPEEFRHDLVEPDEGLLRQARRNGKVQSKDLKERKAGTGVGKCSPALSARWDILNIDVRHRH